jgi:hypothetical protein
MPAMASRIGAYWWSCAVFCAPSVSEKWPWGFKLSLACGMDA